MAPETIDNNDKTGSEFNQKAKPADGAERKPAGAMKRHASKPMWDKDRLSKLTDPQIKSLRANAVTRGEDEIVALCDQLAEERRPPPKASKAGGAASARTAADRQAEKLAAPQLEKFANEMLAIYDLSEDRAAALSAGVTKFVPHKFVSKVGRAKVGGAQMQGIVAFDRYISYRLKHETYAFNIRKALNSDAIVYEIVAPNKYLPHSQPIAELRPHAPETMTSDNSRCGQHFPDFASAAEQYRTILELVAPKLAQ